MLWRHRKVQLYENIFIVSYCIVECLSKADSIRIELHKSRPGVHAILNVCWWRKCPKRCLYLTGWFMTIRLHYQYLFVDELHGPRLIATVVHNWIHSTNFSQCYRLVLHRHTKIKIHQCTLVLIIQVESCKKRSNENAQINFFKWL